MNKVIVKKLDKYGKWSVLGGERKLGVHWQILCCCECGIKKFVTITSLISGKSPGCRRCGSIRHGERQSAEYMAWCNMKIRCYSKTSKDYNSYGARGIKVCDRWRNSFKNFFLDMGRKPTKFHSLDRKDNNGDYEPINCRWATSSEQMKNRRPFKKRG